MKKSLLLILACAMFACAFPQTEPVTPCCAVIKTDVVKNIVTVRDKTTGRLFQFKADAMDMRSIQKDDAVNVLSGKVTSISGAARTYATVQPDYIEPCCNVVSIQVDAAEPVSGAVTIKNTATNNSFTISVPKQIAGTLKKGQPVSMDAANNLAVVQSSYGGSNGETNAYGYPVTSGNETAGNANATDKWVISANNLKGSTGRILFNNPAGSIWTIYIYTMADKKYITSYSESNNKGVVVVLPGEYRITLNDVPVLNVPVKKGHDTKIKCGTLSVVSQGVWYLYDETGTTSYTSGNKAKIMPVPVGTYKLEINGQKQTIVIKNEETVEM